jgi:hypothetical protein
MSRFFQLPFLAVIAALLVTSITPAEAFLFGGRSSGSQAQGEHIIISGGPALRKWELLRRKPDQHDKWWGNFIRSARIRMVELIKKNPSASITWMVYRPGYAARGTEEGQSRISDIESVPEMFARDYKHPIKLIWFDDGQDVINYINRHGGGNKIAGFEYFGHSNRHAFMFDYSSHISGASRAWIHENDLKGISRRAFAKNAFCKSWGCHSGESFIKKFKTATGVRMWGALGKTDYSVLQYGQLPVVSGGSWTQ